MAARPTAKSAVNSEASNTRRTSDSFEKGFDHLLMPDTMKCIHGCRIPEDDIDAVQIENGVLCGTHVDELFRSPESSEDSLGRPKQGRATRESARSTLGVARTRRREFRA